MAGRVSVLVVCCAAVSFVSGAYACEGLSVASWNIAWLGDGINDEALKGNHGTGRYLRKEEDYARLRTYAGRLDADVVALQEIENLDAAHRVFPRKAWRVFISARKPQEQWAQKTAVAVRRGIRAEQLADVRLSALAGFRRGVDMRLHCAGRSFRLLAIHLKARCFRGELSPRNRHCVILARQLPYLEAWIDARAREDVPFIVAGDWERQLAAGSDPVWRELNDNDPSGLMLRLTVGRHKSRCWGGRYPEFIDHIVLGGTASKWLVADSFRQVIYSEERSLGDRLSDHCPVAVRLFR